MAQNPGSLINTSATQSREQDQYKKDFGISNEYLVTLTITGDPTIGNGNFVAVTTLEENFSYSIASNWETPFSKSSAELAASASGAGKAGKILGVSSELARSAAGVNIGNKMLTAQIWQSSDPIKFSFPFTFVAVSDAKKQVRDKVSSLTKCVVPYVMNSVMMRAPGPTLTSNGTSGRNITLQVGKFIRLENCIIRSIDAQFDSLMGADGIPMKAKVTIDIESFFACFTTQDVDKMFGM